MPPWLGLASAGAGLLGGLFGGGSNYGQANQYNSDEANAILGEGVDANTFGNLGAQNIQSYNQYNPLYQQSVGNEANYLNQNLYTNPYSNMALTNATQGTTHAYNQARANLTSGLAQRGLQTAGDTSASGALAGGLASINAQGAATQGAAQQNVAQQSIAQHAQNLQALDQLYGGVASQYYNQGTQAYGQQAGIQGNMAGQYGQMAQSALAQANAAQSAQQQQMGGLIGAAGQLYGMGAGYGATTPQYNPSSYGLISTAQGTNLSPGYIQANPG
jgi:hypothetical protein